MQIPLQIQFPDCKNQASLYNRAQPKRPKKDAKIQKFYYGIFAIFSKSPKRLAERVVFDLPALIRIVDSGPVFERAKNGFSNSEHV
jgi:hypothetical protein